MILLPLYEFSGELCNFFSSRKKIHLIEYFCTKIPDVFLWWKRKPVSRVNHKNSSNFIFLWLSSSASLPLVHALCILHSISRSTNIQICLHSFYTRIALLNIECVIVIRDQVFNDAANGTDWLASFIRSIDFN